MFIVAWKVVFVYVVRCCEVKPVMLSKTSAHLLATDQEYCRIHMYYRELKEHCENENLHKGTCGTWVYEYCNVTNGMT